jgi:hypothetical protein
MHTHHAYKLTKDERLTIEEAIRRGTAKMARVDAERLRIEVHAAVVHSRPGEIGVWAWGLGVLASEFDVFMDGTKLDTNQLKDGSWGQEVLKWAICSAVFEYRAHPTPDPKRTGDEIVYPGDHKGCLSPSLAGIMARGPRTTTRYVPAK